MPLAQSLLPEFDQEMETTRRILSAAPDDQLSWRPHPKSYTLGELSLHLARVPSWASITLSTTVFDTNPPGGHPRPLVESTARTLGVFDDNVAEARAAIASASDADVMVPWSLASSGRVLFTLPRIAVLRSFVMNHLIHHRGQLTVYLRMRDVPLPPVYGPTADGAS